MSTSFRNGLRDLGQKYLAQKKAEPPGAEERDRLKKKEDERQARELKRRQKRVKAELKPILKVVNREYLRGQGDVRLSDKTAEVELVWEVRGHGASGKSLILALSPELMVEVKAGRVLTESLPISDATWRARTEELIISALSDPSACKFKEKPLVS